MSGRRWASLRRALEAGAALLQIVTTTEPDPTPAAKAGRAPASALKPDGGKTRGSRRLRVGLEWLAVVLVALLAALGIKAWVLQAFYIPSGSMIPTLDIGDRILVDKLSYHMHPVHRGDIVVFATPPADTGDPGIKDLVKRVIGLPGDRITSADGHVYIDGHQLSEPYLPRGTVTTGIPPQTIPPGHYFVMGDNRSDSKDSRFFGPISGKLIVGRAILRVWPITRLSIL